MSRQQVARIFAEESGFPGPMADEIIGRILTDARRPSLLNRLRNKLSAHSIFSKSQVWVWVAPGNVPDPIALAVVSAGIQKAELILKLSRQNERTGRALVSALKKPDQKVKIVTDPRGLKKLSGRADAWVVYGSDATVQKLQSRAPRAAGRVSHGHRISMSVVFNSALKRSFSSTVSKCARDIWLYDQRGCLSPQTIWVEGDARVFARSLQAELEKLSKTGGPIRRPADVQEQRRRSLEELKVRSLNPQDLELIGDPGPIVYLLKRGRFTTPAIGQVVAVKSFKTLPEIIRTMKPFLNKLQGIAVAGTGPENLRIKKTFANSSAVYFPQVGSLQSPPLDWNLG